MTTSELNRLLEKGLLGPEQHRFLSRIYSREIISIYHEIRTLLYFGVLMFTGGAGILIYKNAGTIGHLLNNTALAIIMMACFWYAGKNRPTFSKAQVESPSSYYDYVVLLGALLFIALEGYLQAVYSLFGNQWGLAAAIPALVFWPLAYLYDHRGVLSVAIVSATTAIGLQISAYKWMASNIFKETDLIYPATLLGTGIWAAGLALDRLKLKQHFTFTYLLWSATLVFTSLLAALFKFEPMLFFAAVLLALSATSVRYAQRTDHFVFLLYGAVFGYITTTYLVSQIGRFGSLFWFVYFIVSCLGLIIFIIVSIKTFAAGRASS